MIGQTCTQPNMPEPGAYGCPCSRYCSHAKSRLWEAKKFWDPLSSGELSAGRGEWGDGWSGRTTRNRS